MKAVCGWVVRTGRKGAGLALMLTALAGSVCAGPTPPPAPGVPEIDPGSMASAVTLLIGAACLTTQRSRKS
jgi:hypothetical protein